MIELKIYKLHPDVPTPKFGTEQSACFDLTFCMAGTQTYTAYTEWNVKQERAYFQSLSDKKSVLLGPGERALLPTGLIFDIPAGYSIRVHPRSGLALKQGLTLANCEGVIDSDYVEPSFIAVYNASRSAAQIYDLTRLAQAELVKNIEYTFKELMGRPPQKTDRVGGFGSTGVNNSNG